MPSNSSEKPKIYCFINGQFGPSDVAVMALAEDGTPLGTHVSSGESYAQMDIGYREGTFAARRRSDYADHYPDGYELEWVETAKRDEHEGLQVAIAAAAALEDQT